MWQARKRFFFAQNASFFPESSKIWEQHILKSLEKKKLWNNYWPVDTKKKLYFFVGQNFFFSVAWPSALRATEKKILTNKKKIFFWINGQKLFQSFFLFQLLKIFIITNFFHENGHQKFFQYFYTKMVTQNFINVFALKWSPQTFCNVFTLKSYQKFFNVFTRICDQKCFSMFLQ